MARHSPRRKSPNVDFNLNAPIRLLSTRNSTLNEAGRPVDIHCILQLIWSPARRVAQHT